MQRLIRWTEKAEKQYLDTLQQLQELFPDSHYHLKVQERVTETTKLLKRFPSSGAVFTEIKGVQVRKIVITFNYSIFYKLSETEIQIVTFWDNRQNPKRLDF